MIPDLYERKLGLLEIFIASWRIYTANFKFLLLFVFLLNFLAYRINYSLIIWSGLKISLPAWMSFHWSIYTVFVPLITALSSVFVIQITVDTINGECVMIRNVFRRSVRCFLAVTGVWLICTSAACLKQLTAFNAWRWMPIPSIESYLLVMSIFALHLILMTFFLFVYQAIVLKNKLTLSSFRYSFQTVRGRWWKILWAWAVITLPAGAVCFLIRRMVTVVGFGEIGQHVMWALSALIYSFSIIGITILFLNIDRKNHSSCPSC